MYTEFYGLSELPFQLTPDPRYYYESRGHKSSMSYLVYGLEKAEGFIVLTGEIGSGKTLLLDRLLFQIDPDSYVSCRIETTLLEADDLLRLIAQGFGLTLQNLSKSLLLGGLSGFFADTAMQGKRPLIIVDEVQNLPQPALEELRMLSNMRHVGAAMVQTILVGQSQFRERLGQPDLEQLRQRVVATSHLGALDPEQTRAYVEHRLTSAGWTDDPRFVEAAYTMIYRATGGLPRRVNTLLDRLLLLGCLEEVHEIGQELVHQVVSELRQEGLLPTVQVAANEGVPQ